MKKITYIIKGNVPTPESEKRDLFVAMQGFGGAFAYVENYKGAKEFETLEKAEFVKESLEKLVTLDEFAMSFQILKLELTIVDALNNEDVEILETNNQGYY